jgi:hypothetical protein
MKASRLICILAKHMNDRDGGDFEVGFDNGRSAPIDPIPVTRCWLYPGLRRIVISAEPESAFTEHNEKE